MILHDSRILVCDSRFSFRIHDLRSTPIVTLIHLRFTIYDSSTHKSTVNVDDEVMSETPTEEGGGGETPRSRSNVWKNFTRIGKDEEGYKRATFNNCSHAYKVGRNPVSGQNYGTSHLTRHTCKVSEEGYICLTAHFADENWKLCSKILNFCRVKPPHTGIELEATLFECLKQWGIDKKVFSITLDNASTNEHLQDILKTHLCVQSNLLSEGSYYSTSSLYFTEVWKIQCLLEANQSSDDSVIKEMSMKMKTKFDKYWTNYSVVLAFGAILDPRLKVAFLTYCYEALDPSTRLEKVKHVTDKFDKLYEEYATNYTNSNTSLSQSFIDSTSSSISSGERTKPKRAKIGFNQFLSETSSPIGHSYGCGYLIEACGHAFKSSEKEIQFSC